MRIYTLILKDIAYIYKAGDRYDNHGGGGTPVYHLYIKLNIIQTLWLSVTCVYVKSSSVIYSHSTPYLLGFKEAFVSIFGFQLSVKETGRDRKTI